MQVMETLIESRTIDPEEALSLTKGRRLHYELLKAREQGHATWIVRSYANGECIEERSYPTLRAAREYYGN